ncbi:hypothetical protein FPZ42_06075 [Mucilaginibacter achroorhodeus]|uniref:Uncharacterized protein n=1 Tax=Mucilaginibacter achroorhodeus TaxID=2599294 RepID=A0A563U5L5_9SPHI|nr:hypothetical protein [Mucilaginibacter achroorhodeus]TWR26605.1 hypothetical protein FPZ42_06075 [Mucilaginibacter achroorhodeus]
MNTLHSDTIDWLPGKSWIAFIFATLAVLWLAHAVAFFPHEYAHAFTAWILGWKSNPVALNYGNFNLANILIQIQMDENVDYAPIFSSGHGHQAGFIALAGLLIGNLLITYPLSLWLYYYAKRRKKEYLAFFSYWLCVASVGNLIDYVPVRTFGKSGDMYTLAKGFNISPWVICITLGVLFILILLHFLTLFAPKALQIIFPQSAARRVVTVILTSGALFGFYGAVGLLQDSETSHMISKVSIFLLIPVSLALGIWLTERKRKSQLS